MLSQRMDFDDRVHRLLRKHKAMTRGYTTRMRPDGLIEVRPRRARPPVTGASALIFVGVFLLFKGFLLASLGPVTYADRLARLQSGTALDQAGAFAMQIDPASRVLADLIAPVL